MKDNTSIVHIEIPPTPCSQLGEPAEIQMVPKLIAAIQEKAAINRLMQRYQAVSTPRVYQIN
jgi:hypothetical protein